jgi:hypothetical protein
MFDFVMKMFSEGDAALPALGGGNSKTTSYQLPAILFCTIQKSSTFVKILFSPIRVLK